MPSEVNEEQGTFDPNDPRCMTWMNQDAKASVFKLTYLPPLFRIDDAHSRLNRCAKSHESGAVNTRREAQGVNLHGHLAFGGPSVPFRHRLLRLRATQPKLFSEPISSDGVLITDTWLQECLG